MRRVERRRATDSAEVRTMLARIKEMETRRPGPLRRLPDVVRAEDAATYQPGAHPLGDRVWDVIGAARDCHHDTHHVDESDSLIRQLALCMDLASTTPATRPQAASPSAPHFSNRTRSSERGAVPMNPIQSHHSSATSRAPGSVRALDSAHWLHEYYRVEDHFDRCEVVRRAADYMAGLLRLDPDAAADRTVGESEDDVRARIVVEAYGHDLKAASERFERRSVIQARLAKGHHPVRGVAWTPPEENFLAAHEARAMRDAGLTTADIARALGCNASTVRNWTTAARHAA